MIAIKFLCPYVYYLYCMRSAGRGHNPLEVMPVRMKVKVIFCILLMLLAAWSAAVVLGSIGVLPVSAPEAEPDGYLLGEYEGYVAVWYPAGAGAPAMITEIRAGDLHPYGH